MPQTEDTLTTTDGQKLHINQWAIDAPKAVVIIAHGLAEHSGRYAYVAAQLNKAGYSVVAPDHRAHGKSDGEPRACVKDFTVFVDDLNLLWDKSAAEYPDTPMFLVGHSMGGLIATMFALRYQDKMRGLVTSGAGLMAGEGVPKIALLLGKIIAKIAPMLGIAQLESADVSRDPAVVADYDSDPLNYRGKVRAGFATDMLGNGEKVLRNAAKLKLPMLIMHGEGDRLVPPEASKLLYEGSSSDDKTVKIYPELYHEIFNEPEKDTVIADLVVWLDAH
jgi:acylglycerol lipase